MAGLFAFFTVCFIILQIIITTLFSWYGFKIPVFSQATQASESNKIFIKNPPDAYTINQSAFIAQSFNNCGPASLAMVFAMNGKTVSQEELASEMRPFNNPAGGVDDKSVFPDEFVLTSKRYGFNAMQRPNGDIKLIKQLVANDIPVIVRTWLNPDEDIGHFRIVRGYDDKQQIITQDDSYQGPDLTYTYDEFMGMWKPFNYGYILVYPKEKQALVEAILGENKDEKKAWENALKRAQKDITDGNNETFALFNASTANYHLGKKKEAIEYFEQAEPNLPSRTLWYQYEPLLAYRDTGNFDKVFTLTDAILTGGDEAYSELYQIRGEVYKKQGNKELAKEEFEKALYYNENYKAAKVELNKL